MHRTSCLILLFLALSLGDSAWGQTGAAPALQPLPGAAPPKPVTPAATPPGQKKITVEAAVRQAFRIDPMVNRIETRPGRIVPFEFGITGDDKPVRLEIQPVALTQDETGAIGPDLKVPAPVELEVQSPPTVDMKPGGQYLIKGRIRVPNTQSTFHTYGILVRDAGQLTNTPKDEASNSPRIGIRFVTQYLLRCDIKVLGTKTESAAKLKVEKAELVDINGAPEARIYVSNPTDGPIEFNLNTQIRHSKDSSPRPSFPLWMPVRANTDVPERYTARVLPGARIRMIAPLDSAIFPGEYYMEAAMMWDNRVLGTHGFPILVQEGDFPASALATVLVAPQIEVSPSQLSLSLQRGGQRTQILELDNAGTRDAELELIPESHDGTPAPWMVVRPDKVKLQAGASRKVSANFAVSGDPNAIRYGRIRVKTHYSDGTTAETASLVVAGLGRAALPPVEFTAEKLQWDASHVNPAFVIEVKNTGNRHIPIDGIVVLGDEAARPIELRGGFGKWVLPGTTEKIRFKPPQGLPEGHYTARVILLAGPGTEPVEQRLEIDFVKSAKSP